MRDQYSYLERITAYNSYANSCEYCSATCLANKNAERSRCIELCRDCAELCRLTVTLMLRHSDYAVVASQLCRVACLACAEECALYADLHCQECARTCQVCAAEPLVKRA
ncbi:uncharacterized protein DUF326 [Ectopseudomonas oleovorans]|uniref:Uncharacterized protein DUF326 n=1 Tax=Ectopseudomonas oleovorans TaxID=301 RepID=A0A397NML2_ECTOL|nr:four-helix bundle copper-binding protein [Pseudomonas oleovorans]RIA35965.1 uncharacterized protein DUF326 [Pseudomonas oleovorans]